jgi:uncharacterized repeat protein (TIGR01451 family)
MGTTVSGFKRICSRGALVALISGLFLLPALTGRPASADPAQELRTETPIASTAADRNAVTESYVSLYDPLPASVPEHPAACDRISYLRFRSPQGPQDPAAADAVLVGMPGWTGGASLQDQIARNIVKLAAERGRHVEFWSLDRRSNCLEDHTGVDAAAATGDYRTALDYYYRGSEINGRRFAGFKQNADVTFLADFGLKQTLEDQYFVMTHELPDPDIRARRMFCGGISLGGPLTAAFASWDFDGDPATTNDAGYKQCAGFFALDTSIQNFGRCFDASSCDANRLTELGPGLDPVLDQAVYNARLAALHSGEVPLFMNSAPITPEVFQLLSVIALGAHDAPGEETHLPSLVPASTGSSLDTTMRFLFSRDATVFATGTPSIRDFRLTNEALLGALIDDNSNPISIIQSSVGTFDGGPVVEKDFPVPGTAGEVSLFGSNFTALTGAGRLMIPSQPNGPLYTWRNYDHVGDPDAPTQVDPLGRPFTNPGQEVTDIQELARSIFEGPADWDEQYFPNRILLDLAALAGDRTGDLDNMRYDNGPSLRPVKAIWAGDGIGSPPGFTTSDNGVLAPGYTHVDTATAAARQNNGNPEIGSKTLTDWIFSSAFHLRTNADLSVGIADSADPVTDGDHPTYTLTAANVGPESADSVAVTQQLPGGVDFVNASPGCSESSGTVTCKLGDIANNAGATATVEVVTHSSGTLTTTASVSAPGNDDAVAANDLASETTTVEPAADVSVSQTDSPDPVVVGNRLTYTLTVANGGPDTAIGVALADALPRTVRVLSITESQGRCALRRTHISCELGDVGASDAPTVTVVVRPTRKGTITNRASVSASQPLDRDATNNASAETTTVS